VRHYYLASKANMMGIAFLMHVDLAVFARQYSLWMT
jgi:hypothetical protein